MRAWKNSSKSNLPSARNYMVKSIGFCLCRSNWKNFGNMIMISPSNILLSKSRITTSESIIEWPQWCTYVSVETNGRIFIKKSLFVMISFLNTTIFKKHLRIHTTLRIRRTNQQNLVLKLRTRCCLFWIKLSILIFCCIHWWLTKSNAKSVPN